MNASTLDPNVLRGLIIFGVIAAVAMLSRWALNIKDDIEDRREAKAKKLAGQQPH